MALAQIGQGLLYPGMECWMPGTGGNPTLNSGYNLNAAGYKFAWIGRVWLPDRGTKSIRKAQFLTSSVVSAGGSGLTFSLQNVDTATGNPTRPDGTQDQTAGFLLSTVSGWFTTPALSADRSVTHGDLLAAVIEWDGSGRLGADTISFGNWQTAGLSNNSASTSHYNGSWGSFGQNASPIILFEMSDGTFGTFAGCIPSTGGSGLNVTTATTPDEYALRFQLPFSCKVDGAWALMNHAASTRDAVMTLYDNGGSSLAATTNDAETVQNYAYRQELFDFSSEVQLSANTTYRLSWKPTTAGNTQMGYASVAANSHFAVWPGGIQTYLSSRTDGGAWTDTDTQRPWFGIRISSLDDGASTGVAGVIGS